MGFYVSFFMFPCMFPCFFSFLVRVARPLAPFPWFFSGVEEEEEEVVVVVVVVGLPGLRPGAAGGKKRGVSVALSG
jgi:hypothetical protein